MRKSVILTAAGKIGYWTGFRREDAETGMMPKAKPGAARENPRRTALTIKGRPEWRDWVDRGAEFCRTDVAKLVDAALVEYLKQRGFDEPAPKR